MLVQDEWVTLKLQIASEGRQGPSGFVVHEEVLRFAMLLELLAAAVVRRLGMVRTVYRRWRFPARLRSMGINPS